MRRLTPVRVSDHALERYLERVGSTGRVALENQVRRHLMPYLQQGARVTNGAVMVELQWGVVAVAYPSLEGGWVVSTVMEVEE